MSRVDAFDISVLRLEDGVRWATDAVERDDFSWDDRLAAIYYPHLVQAIRSNPEILKSYVLKGKSLALSDIFLDIVSRVPAGMMREYEGLRALARRFGPGANDWVRRKWRSDEEFTRRDDEPRESMPDVVVGYKMLSGLDYIDLYAMDAYLAAFLCHSMMDLVAMARGNDALSNSAHFDFANGVVIVGMPPRSKSFFEPSSDYVPVLMEDAFGHIIPETVDVRLSHEPGSGLVSAALKADLLGHSVFTYLEPYARRVEVRTGEVLVDFRPEPRSLKEPLFYEYSGGFERRGVEPIDGSFMRVEVKAAPGMKGNKIFGTIAGICRAYDNGAKLYIEGSRGISSSSFHKIGDPFGFEEGVVDLVAAGPEAQTALMGAFTAIGGYSMRAI
jgi:hypothetical protein